MSKSSNPEGKSGKGGGPAWLGKRQGGGKVKQDPDWKKAKVVQADLNAGYKVKRLMLWAVCLILFGLFVYWLLPPKNTPLVVFRAAPYDLNMPPLSLAKEDTDFLRKVSQQNLRDAGTVLFSRKEEDSNSNDGSPQEFLAQLRTVRPSAPGWFSRGNVIIYISAHGLVNDQGEACLVPPNANPFTPDAWLPLAKFLRQICDLPNLKRARKIVILDCNRIGTRWRSGVLDNRFADRLTAVAEEVNDDNLYLLSSASSGQVGWSAPELRGTVFGHFLGRGLRGEASKEQPRDHSSGVVSLQELYAYLSDRVDDYVQQRRGARQTPLLIGPKGRQGVEVKDIPLVVGDYWQKWETMQQLRSSYDVLGNAKDLLERQGSRPSPVHLAWEAYRRRLGGGVEGESIPLSWKYGFVHDPIRFAQIEQEMMALEERLFAGEDYQVRLPSQWESLASKLADRSWQEFPVAQGVTNMRLEEWQQRAVTIPLPRGEEDGGARNFEDLFQAWREAKKEPGKPRPQIQPTEQNQAIRAMLARYGLDGANDDPSHPTFNRNELSEIDEFLELHPRAPNAAEGGATETAVAFETPRTTLLPLEGHFLRLLRHNVSDPAESQMKAAVLARSLSERAATPTDVRAHYALELLVNKADQERRLAEDAFFLGDSVSVDGTGPGATENQINNSAARRWMRAVGKEALPLWSEENDGYHGAINWSRELEEMFLLRDRVWATFPYWSEWYFRRARLELARSLVTESKLAGQQELLLAVMNGNVLLSEQLERLLEKRGREADLRTEFNNISNTYNELRINWNKLQQLADDARIVDAEGNFVKQENIWRFELAMQSPLLVESRVNRLLIKYLNTLVDWSDPAKELRPPAERAKDQSAASAPATKLTFLTEKEVDETFLPKYQEFWLNYHRLLTHKFVSPYKDHLPTLEKGGLQRLDETVRQTPKAAPLWSVLNSVLTDYDTAFSTKASLLTPDASDIAIRAELSRWDRRVRADAFWLPCIILNVSGQETKSSAKNALEHRSRITDSAAHPASRLREVDHWHLTCWHAHRLLNDFWGNGLLYDTGRQYFELAVEQCKHAAGTVALPFRYEPPGQPIENLNTLYDLRVKAYQAGLTLDMPNVEAQESKAPKTFEGKVVQQARSPDDKTINFPGGRAGFYLAQPNSYLPLNPDTGNWGESSTLFRSPVPFVETIQRQYPEYKLPCAIFSGKLTSRPAFLDGRVWYRGHIWSDQFEVYDRNPMQGIRFVHQAKRYSAPTVQVFGDDGPSGAVIFVFDCSRSMTTISEDGKLTVDVARGELEKILAQLSESLKKANRLNGESDLVVGLMAYAYRTRERGDPEVDQFYDERFNRDKPKLTPAGERMKLKLDAAFDATYPHPDADVGLLVPPTKNWISVIDDQGTSKLTKENCKGVTPLYYATKLAIEAVSKVPNVASRQVIVISDGVNFPNGGARQKEITLKSGKKAMVPILFADNATKQNEADWKALQETLIANISVKVRTVLFGVGEGGLLDTQFDQLLKLGEKAPHFQLENVPNAALIGQSIEKAFEKPLYAVYPQNESPPTNGWNPFAEPWFYPNWTGPRDLLALPTKHSVEVRGPRVRERLAQDIELSGGEAITLRYQANPPQLLFHSPSLDTFGEAQLEPTGSAVNFERPVVAEMLEPVVEAPRDLTRPTTFQVRLRSRSNDVFVPRPKFVWAEIQPNSDDPKHQKLMFQCFDLKFVEKTSTPILEFTIPQWPKGVQSAKINLWVRYTTPRSALSHLPQPVKIQAGETNFMPIDGKDDLDGVKFRIEQVQTDASKRTVRIIETHPLGTALAKLYRTRVQLSPPPRSIVRTYGPIDASPQLHGEVVHEFEYETDYVNQDLTLEINSVKQVKQDSFQLEAGAPLVLKNWNQ